MTDEEIIQLNELKSERDKLRKIIVEAKRINNRDDDGEGLKAWLYKFLNIKGNNKQLDIQAEMSSTSCGLPLNMCDFKNEIVQERIRELLASALDDIRCNLQLLENDISTALAEYKGQDLYTYIREKVKLLHEIESKVVN